MKFAATYLIQLWIPGCTPGIGWPLYTCMFVCMYLICSKTHNCTDNM